jgi:Secretion system C-terminal sorting domain
VCIEDLGPCAPVGVDEFAMNDFGMSQNFPNPADENTTFEFVIPAKGQVRVVLADMIGQVIDVMVDESLASGLHTIRYNTANLAPGLYTYTLVYEGQQLTKRMLITR